MLVGSGKEWVEDEGNAGWESECEWLGESVVEK